MKIFLYESGWENLQPLTLTRPVWELRCGALVLSEKLEVELERKIDGFICREHLAPLVKRQHPHASVNILPAQETLFFQSRVLMDIDDLLKQEDEAVFACQDEIIGIHLRNPDQADLKILPSGEITGKLEHLPRKEVKATVLKYLWDFIEVNPQQIETDLLYLRGMTFANSAEYALKNVHILDEKGVLMGDNVSISPGVVIDANEGPVILGDGVKILPNAVIIGPAAIGKGSVIKIGAKIYPGTSVGPFCKAGGEIENSIIQGYSNKQHEGFLGHSFIGEWCNLGAGTENSNLKNNYSPVKVQIGNHRISSGRLFVGLLMGDHTKTGINTTFNTGSVIEVAAMAYGAGFQPRYIPSFHWSDSGKLRKAGFDESIRTAQIVMSRRGVELAQEEMELMKRIYEEGGE